MTKRRSTDISPACARRRSTHRTPGSPSAQPIVAPPAIGALRPHPVHQPPTSKRKSKNYPNCTCLAPKTFVRRERIICSRATAESPGESSPLPPWSSSSQSCSGRATHATSTPQPPLRFPCKLRPPPYPLRRHQQPIKLCRLPRPPNPHRVHRRRPLSHKQRRQKQPRPPPEIIRPRKRRNPQLSNLQRRNPQLRNPQLRRLQPTLPRD